jgi:hypothetical protein
MLELSRIVRRRFSLAAGLCVIALATMGCASTMSKAECRAVDWRTIGYEDGVAGHSGDRIAVHRKACAKHKVTPDLDLYQFGRSAGLLEYCRPANAFRVGARGASYGGVCPADLHDEFFSAYESGFQLHALRSRVGSVRQQLEATRRELAGAEDGMVRNSLVIVSTDSTAEQRAEALIDTRRLAERTGQLKEEIRQLEIDKLYYEQEYEAYRASVAFAR